MQNFRTIARAAVTCFMLCAVTSASIGQAVVNIDVGNGGGTYAGQGVIVDPGNGYWNGVAGSANNLLASDGVTPTGIHITLASAGGFNYANPNLLLSDYQYVTTFFGPAMGTIAITGLQPSTSYLVYTFSAGDQDNQAGVITLNGATGCTTGSISSQFTEGANYVLLEVISDASGAINGSWLPFFTSGAINGFQIIPGSLPTRVTKIKGAESPTVNSPGDIIRATLEFTEAVTLSQVGGAQLQLDIDGTFVTATQVGSVSGKSLSFEGIAPALTTMNAKVVANSLQLTNGATLRDDSQANVGLSHDEVALPNDQISVQRLSVYPPVPTLAESPHYRFRVREVGGAWQSSFAWFTKCIDDAPVTPFGYYNQFIGGWSHSYCNFEMANNVPVEIEITRIDPTTGQPIDISKATPHPRRKVKSWTVTNGRAYVTIERPTLFAVDIDGQMDENPTPSAQFINQNAFHCVSIFANPFILDKPDLNDPNVFAVDPGVIPPDDGTWTTLYFKPGVHKIFPGTRWAFGDDFRVRGNKSYYIPGDAIVHGNFNNRDDNNDGLNIRIFGHGTLSGEKIDHYVELGLTEADSWRTRPIRIANDSRGCRVEGITIADPANHSCTLVAGFNGDPADYNYVRWTKAISWRANGDGISPNGSGYVEDCFLRTQDDGSYIIGLGIRRMVYWHDVNGMPLRCDFLTARTQVPYKDPLLVEDIDVIYARTGFGGGAGRSVIGYPEREDATPGNTGNHVIFRDINVEDPFPTRILFGWDLGMTIATSTGVSAVGPVAGVRFENIRAAAPAIDNTQDILMAGPMAPIQGLVFDNVTLAGQHYSSIFDFNTNNGVTGLSFLNTNPTAMTYLNTSGYGKWYINKDWDTGIEPANNDVVNHTAIGGVLRVDASVYAGSLNIGHSSTATVVVATDGKLTVKDSINIGVSGGGALHLHAGTVILEGLSAEALMIKSGSLHIERGVLHWAGSHFDDIKQLLADELISFGNGTPAAEYPYDAFLLRSAGDDRLFVRYDAMADITSVWVAMAQW